MNRLRRLLHRLRPNSLASRLALTFFVVVLAANILLEMFISRSVERFSTERLGDQLVNESRLISVIVGDTPYLDEATALDSLAASLAARIAARVTIIDRDGLVIGESDRSSLEMVNHAARPEVAAALAGEVGTATRWSETLGEMYFYVAQAASATAPVVRVAVPTTEISDAIDVIEWGIRLGTAAAALMVGVVGIVVAQRISEPLARLSQQATAVAQGDLTVQVEPADTIELGEVGRAFNVMTVQLRLSQAEAEESQARLAVTVTNLTDGVVLTDDRGDVIQINPAAAAMLGVSTAAAGVPFVQLCRDHELARLLTDALTSPGVKRGVVEYVRTRRFVEVSAQRIASPSERLAVIVLRDITELRKLEGVRREFVANVSHELRTPLASIRALVETLEAGAIDEPAIAEDFLRRIVNEVDRLAALVDELLDLARLESGRIVLNREVLPSAAVLRHGMERLRPQVNRAGLLLVNDLPDELPAVLGDRARIEQVMLNLIHNAIKFTPAGGTISVRAVVEPEAVRVLVADTGVGIPAGDLPRVFERFYKADRARTTGGTGLGLAISKHIVQTHGGQIGVTSSPDRGATFWFTVPRAEPNVLSAVTRSGAERI